MEGDEGHTMVPKPKLLVNLGNGSGQWQSKVVQPRCHDVARVVGSGHLFTVTWRKLCSPVVMMWREWWMVGACSSLKYG